MTLHPQAIGPVPEETARGARAACPKGNPYLAMRDLLGPLYEDQQCAALFPPQGPPACAPWRLALVTIMQFAEGLSDRQAAEAVRVRLDWKYARNLELTDPGFDFSILCEFRARLVTSGPSSSSLRRCLATSKRVGSAKLEDSNARIRPMSLPPSGRSTAGNGWERRCAMPWRRWPWWRQAGCFNRPAQKGRSGMSSASRSLACRPVKRTA
jgi:transposase